MSDYAIKRLIPKPTNLGIGSKDSAENTLNWLPNKITTSKYTLLSFIPLNFFHQIRKGSTFFFFITLILLSIPRISPFEPYTYLFAFFIVVGVSMIKDAMEDYKRHCDDELVNNAKIEILSCVELGGGDTKFLLNEKKCMEIHPGDFVIMRRNQEIYADIILLRSKTYHKDKLQCANHCFVQTSSLDGESNLKKKNAIETPKHYSCCRQTEEVTANLNDIGSPCYEHFFNKIHSFNLKDTGDSFDDFECDLNIDGKLAIANEKNVILRGSTLKNTETCLGLVVGVGMNTKLIKSLDKSKRTKTLFDSRMNFVLGISLAVYFFMMITTIAFGTIFLNAERESVYLNVNSFGSSLLTIIFSNYILYIYLIPLSLYVMLEIARFIHSAYISRDPALYLDGVSAKCRNSSAIEDLGVIDFILTDKTGTITKNEMTLRQLHMDKSNTLTEPDEFFKSLKNYISDTEKATKIEKLADILNSETPEKTKLLILLNMLICNSVEILNKNPEGVSQEELCFLETTTKSGFSLSERAENYVIINILGEKINIEIVGTREFASKRQRMDVVVKICGKAYLLAKGSDQKLLDKEKDKEKLQIINKSNDFRSLVLKYKELTNKEVKDFLKATVVNIDTFDEDKQDMASDKELIIGRKKKEQEGFNELEIDALYLGTVFIEDEMQEEVEETMKELKQAGIKVWMVTGDKKETAVACARSSCLIENDDFIALSGRNAIKRIEDSIKMETPVARSLNNLYGMRDNTTVVEEPVDNEENVFSKKSLVVYRATPSQKGKIASLLTESGRNTLAIGDGNNDIGMLMGSNVGIGVIGKEGTQAAMAGDFAIPQFKLLKNLLFIHGRYCLQRYTSMALNSYYKNIVFIFAQFIYNLYSGASGRPLYSSLVFNYYNLFLTSMIPFAVALFDKDMDQASAMRQPKTYRNARIHFNNWLVYSNVLFAIIEATIIFFLIKVFLINEIANGTGIITGYSTVSTVFSIVILFGVLLRQIRCISFRVSYTNIAIALSIFINVITIVWVQELYTKSKYAVFHLLNSTYFYFVIFSMFSLVYLADTIFENVNLHLFEKLKEKEKN